VPSNEETAALRGGVAQIVVRALGVDVLRNRALGDVARDAGGVQLPLDPRRPDLLRGA
jgi:hypothetical protein